MCVCGIVLQSYYLDIRSVLSTALLTLVPVIFRLCFRIIGHVHVAASVSLVTTCRCCCIIGHCIHVAAPVKRGGERTAVVSYYSRGSLCSISRFTGDSPWDLNSALMLSCCYSSSPLAATGTHWRPVMTNDNASFFFSGYWCHTPLLSFKHSLFRSIY